MWFKNQEMTILIIGTGDVGLTTILHKLEENVIIKPIISSVIETFQYEGLTVNSWDNGAAYWIREKTRQIPPPNGLIFVIGCDNVGQVDDGIDYLHEFLGEANMRNVPLLVYANKQDIPNATKPNELERMLNCQGITDRPWKVQGTCAITGDSIYEGINWLGEQINKMK